MAETVSQHEAVPEPYPSKPNGLSAAAQALDAALIWHRLESYMAHRFTERDVVWVVDGEGAWTFPLVPATLTSAERWNGEAWESASLEAGPFGFCIDGQGPYRISANVGDADAVPEAVQESYRRLAEYLAPDTLDGPLAERAGASSQSAKVSAGSVDIHQEFDRAPTWLARAMQYSGAADLLRPYRRA